MKLIDVFKLLFVIPEKLNQIDCEYIDDIWLDDFDPKFSSSKGSSKSSLKLSSS